MSIKKKHCIKDMNFKKNLYVFDMDHLPRFWSTSKKSIKSRAVMHNRKTGKSENVQIVGLYKNYILVNTSSGKTCLCKWIPSYKNSKNRIIRLSYIDDFPPAEIKVPMPPVTKPSKQNK